MIKRILLCSISVSLVCGVAYALGGSPNFVAVTTGAILGSYLVSHLILRADR